jgi:hypothetical protein
MICSGTRQGSSTTSHASTGDAGEDGDARGVEAVDDVDAESVLFERNDGRCKRLVVRQCGEAVRCGGCGHLFVLLAPAELT